MNKDDRFQIKKFKKKKKKKPNMIPTRKTKPKQMLKNLFVTMVFMKENSAGRCIRLYE